MQTPPPPFPAPPTVSINLFEWMRCLIDGQTQTLGREMINALDVLGGSVYVPLDPATRQRNNFIVQTILYIFSQPGFFIPDNQSEEFIRRNHTISNLVANSDFKNTDVYLEIIRNQQNNFVKLLTLYSARNTVHFDREAIFKLNPLLASMWYMQYSELFHSGLVSPAIEENLRRHFEFSSSLMLPVFNLQEPYFGSSYINSGGERTIKACLNASVQKATHKALPTCMRDSRKIAVLSTHWRSNHSVYRICSALVEGLRHKYHLTFVQLGNYASQEIEGFDAVRQIESQLGIPNVAPILENDYQMIIYPDVGMACESIALANLRLAPIQICMLGHSVSTFGADIDYFVSGAEVEVPETPEKNYSERLILLPGMGCVHNLPIHKHTRTSKLRDRIIINCPWQAHKINSMALQTLARIIKGSRKPIGFRFFIGTGTGLYNDHPSFLDSIIKVLGSDNFEARVDLPYGEYMTIMEQGHFSLDAWHFGGCNTVSDSLYTRVPIVCREGERWYNRIGPRMLRLAGFPELIVGGEQEYIDLSLKLIHDDSWREAITRRLDAADLESTIYTKSDVPHFADAVDYIMKNHESLKASGDRSPLRFPRVGQQAT